MITGWPHSSESFCPNARARMSVALPAVKGTTSFTGFAGHACADASRTGNDHMVAAASSASVKAKTRIAALMAPPVDRGGTPSAQSVADRHVLGNECEAARLRDDDEQLREVLIRQAEADHCLDSIARQRCERHRHFEAARSVEAEIEILAQQRRRKRDGEIEVDERRRLVARERGPEHAPVHEI